MKQSKTVEKIKQIKRKIRQRLIIIVLFICALLGACTSSPELVVPEPERVKLELSDPRPIRTKDVDWIVITENNYQDVFQELKDKKYDAILIGLTDKDYENISVNNSEFKRYIIEQQFIISSYKQYYEKSEDVQDKENLETD